jgi:hypothetical protein
MNQSDGTQAAPPLGSKQVVQQIVVFKLLDSPFQFEIVIGNKWACFYAKKR